MRPRSVVSECSFGGAYSVDNLGGGGGGRPGRIDDGRLIGRNRWVMAPTTLPDVPVPVGIDVFLHPRWPCFRTVSERPRSRWFWRGAVRPQIGGPATDRQLPTRPATGRRSRRPARAPST